MRLDVLHKNLAWLGDVKLASLLLSLKSKQNELVKCQERRHFYIYYPTKQKNTTAHRLDSSFHRKLTVNSNFTYIFRNILAPPTIFGAVPLSSMAN